MMTCGSEETHAETRNQRLFLLLAYPPTFHRHPAQCNKMPQQQKSVQAAQCNKILENNGQQDITTLKCTLIHEECRGRAV